MLEKLDDEDLDEKTLKESIGLMKNNTIFVRGIAPATTESDLRNLFEEFGQISDI